MMDVKWLKLLLSFLLFLKVEGIEVPITFVQNAVAKGAVCLDGSPPAYHFDKGFGSGINNWLIYLEGGAWCNDAANCLGRSKGGLGSSKLMTTLYTFSGILSNNTEDNPDFYNWNRITVRYCDGSSYTGDVEEIDPVNKIYYRGARVWRAIMDDLLAKGMQNAEKAILAGCSAGGLGAILQCDNFRALLPSQAKVKCLSDAGFFINGENEICDTTSVVWFQPKTNDNRTTKDISGVARFLNFFSQVVDTHGSGKNLPASCVSEFSPELCFFPQYAARFIQTPLFLLNAAYDSWQINYILVPGAADPHGTWNYCKKDITNCSDSQLQIMHGFRQDFLDALSTLGDSTSRGWYINSCYAHCQSGNQATWLRNDSPLLNSTTIAKAVGDWFYDRKLFQEIDCRYPCDKTCHNDVLK